MIDRSGSGSDGGIVSVRIRYGVRSKGLAMVLYDISQFGPCHACYRMVVEGIHLRIYYRQRGHISDSTQGGDLPCASENGENPACISYTRIPNAQ